ncbi:TPA: hypothetical protein ACT3KO_001471 [Raoultella ornithinolytica]
MDKHLYDVFAPESGFQSYALHKKIADGERVTIIAQLIEFDGDGRAATQKKPLRFCSVKISLSDEEVTCVAASEIVEGQVVNETIALGLITQSSLGQGRRSLAVSEIYSMDDVVLGK